MIIGIDGNEANVKNRVGSGQYAFELLKQFASNKKHKFIVFLKEKPQHDLPEESESFKYKIFGPKKLWTQFALPIKLTFGQKPQVFFSTAHYGPRLSMVPYVVTIHDLSYLHYPKLFNKDDLYQLTSWSKYSIKNSAHIIAVSNTTKDDIVKNYKVPPSKISVTYEGFDKNRFKPESKSQIDKIKNKYHINGDYIIFVGTLQPRKNIEKLIEAFAFILSEKSPAFKPGIRAESSEKENIQSHAVLVESESTAGLTPGFSPGKFILPGSDKKLSLVVCGKKGWLFESIFQKTKTLGVKDKVIFTDFVPDEDLPGLISGAKVYVLPSLWEGFGIPVIEAQACGVPVVISNTSSLPEIVNSSGILVDPQSKESIAKGMQKILNNENLRGKQVSKGLINIRRFSWERCAQQTLKILEASAKSR